MLANRILPASALLALFAVLAMSAEEKKPADAPASNPAPVEHKNPFDSNVKVTFTDKYMIVESDGIPTHPHGEFPNASNPNSIRKQNYKFYIPLEPKPAEKPRKTPFGPIGVAINGIPFYNQYNAEGADAVKLEVFDSCCGHPDPQGRYHYHKYPVCVKSPFKDEAGKHSPLIGYAFDGYAIYGPNGEDGKPPTDLDECNGHTDAEHGYHYHVTAGYPYILGGYHGVVEEKNFDHGGPPGGGLLNGRGGPPLGPRGGRPPFGPPPGGPLSLEPPPG
jgi:YHYH protein